MAPTDFTRSKVEDMLLNKIKEHTKFLDNNTVYGIDLDSLTWTQKRRVHDFAKDVEPWLLDHIGDFGVDWFVDVDKEFDSLRLTFKDQETETYFTLAWMHGERLRDSDSVQT